jgi:hypothetical protein
MTRKVGPDALEYVARRCPEIDQFGRQTVEELLQSLLASCKQAVDVPRLRYPAAVLRAVRKLVAFDYHDLGVGVGKHPG